MTFTAKRVTHTYTQKLDATPEQVFPLLCPVREAEWADGWEAKIIYSTSGLAEPNCIFLTAHDGEQTTVWVMTRHDPASHEVEFTTFTPGNRTGRTHIQLADNSDGTTDANITYTFTALSEAGNRFVEQHTEAAFQRDMRHWEQAMNHYLTSGKLLRLHHN